MGAWVSNGGGDRQVVAPHYWKIWELSVIVVYLQSGLASQVAFVGNLGGHCLLRLGVVGGLIIGRGGHWTKLLGLLWAKPQPCTGGYWWVITSTDECFVGLMANYCVTHSLGHPSLFLSGKSTLLLWSPQSVYWSKVLTNYWMTWGPLTCVITGWNVGKFKVQCNWEGASISTEKITDFEINSARHTSLNQFIVLLLCFCQLYFWPVLFSRFDRHIECWIF